MTGPEVFAMVVLFLVIGVVLIAKSEIGRALADQIRGQVRSGDALLAEVAQLRRDLDGVRQELAETAPGFHRAGSGPGPGGGSVAEGMTG